MTVASPCIKICEIDRHTQACIGCGRTLAEITIWPQASDEQKQQIREQAQTRLQLSEKRHERHDS